MENLYLLSQQLMYAQTVAKLQYLAGNAPLAPELHALKLLTLQNLLSDPSKSSMLPPFAQLSLPLATCFPKCNQPCVVDLNLTSTTSEKSGLSSPPPKMDVRESDDDKAKEMLKRNNTPFNGLLSGSKKIHKAKADGEPVQSPETGKYSVQEKGADKKRKNRRPADQIQRMFRCPSEYCNKSYGSETSLKVHIKNKHTSTITPERLCEIDALLSKIGRRNV